jgi:hypothetical protein
MKKILILFAFFFSNAFAQSEYAELFNLEKNTVQVDKVELVKPQVAVSRGVIAAADARQYKMVFANQNTQRRTYTISPKVSISLLTFPNLTPKIATLEILKQQITFNEKLPSEFWGGQLFALTLSGNTITAIREVNQRAVTGVYRQAVYLSKQTTFNPLKLVLDFVFAYTTEREMKRDGKTMDDNPGGLYISNNNPALRTFQFAKDGKIELLKNAGEYVTVSSADLQAALNGTKEFGWGMSWQTHFYATISEVSAEVFVLQQGYEP